MTSNHLPSPGLGTMVKINYCNQPQMQVNYSLLLKSIHPMQIFKNFSGDVYSYLNTKSKKEVDQWLIVAI